MRITVVSLVPNEALPIAGGAGSKRAFSTMTAAEEARNVKTKAKAVFEHSYGIASADEVAANGLLFLTNLKKGARYTMKQMMRASTTASLEQCLSKLKSTNKEPLRISGTGEILLKPSLVDLQSDMDKMQQLVGCMMDLYTRAHF